ncbi:copper amine oxidase N-terminal domain-containing protein [Paenibacillus provencensis]|uniref:Copper amine oxidase N-terminal domain-containing protein n=1 Tax=Paenibacillus provencensis TaxID=441151 RepID=A0ABW3PRE3_9BACL|nr:copper amine oxidase N-terminal domain-containing protein [Paenibacillus sp. MER 78]MCM3128583.1 copper amine oxidase N-terminal domain-containing protein [Paenibacillus sp. MER 78]
MLVVLTGCQSVGGFDVNSAILGSKDKLYQPMESRETLELEVTPSANATAEDKEMIDLLNSISVHIDSAKTEDMDNASVTGSVYYLDNEIPFLFSMDKAGFALDIEGAEKPVYFSLGEETETPEMTEYYEQVEDVTWQLASFLVKHLPNPDTISVAKAQETVNGERLDLTHLHVEISGTEMVELIRPFLASVAEDEEGLKQLIGNLYDAISVMFVAIEAEDESLEGASEFLSPESKDTTVAMIHGAITGYLDELLVDYDQEVEKLFNETPELKTVFGDDTNLTVDYYFDSELNARKAAAELKVAIPASDELPISEIKLASTSEIWNHGTEVKADKVDTSNGVLDVMYGEATTGEILRNFEGSAPVHELLMNSGMTSMFTYLDPEDEYYGVVNNDGTGFVALRNFADQFEADVKWTKGSNQIVVTNDLTLEQSTYTLGSDQAVVNGETVTLPSAPYMEHGMVYVPLRSIAEALDATVTFEDGWYTVERM